MAGAFHVSGSPPCLPTSPPVPHTTVIETTRVRKSYICRERGGDGGGTLKEGGDGGGTGIPSPTVTLKSSPRCPARLNPPPPPPPSSYCIRCRGWKFVITALFKFTDEVVENLFIYFNL